MTAARSPHPVPFRITEAQWQTKVINIAYFNGWLVHHSRPARTAAGRVMTALTGHKGLPDLVLAHPKTHALLLVELKRDGAYLEPDQKRWRDAIPADQYRLWRPADTGEVETTLAHLAGRR